MSDFERIEQVINKEVDQVISNFKENPGLPTEEIINQEDLVNRISRISNEIQQVVSLMLPRKDISQLCQMQDPVVFNSAKALLISQIDRLKILIGRLNSDS